MNQKLVANTAQVWATGVAAAVMGAIIASVALRGVAIGDWALGWEALSAVGTCAAAFAVIYPGTRDEFRTLATSPAERLKDLMTADLSGLPEDIGAALVDSINAVYALKNIADGFSDTAERNPETVVFEGMENLRHEVNRAIRLLKQAHTICENFVLVRLGD